MCTNWSLALDIVSWELGLGVWFAVNAGYLALYNSVLMIAPTHGLCELSLVQPSARSDAIRQASLSVLAPLWPMEMC